MTYETSKPSKLNRKKVDMSPQAVSARLRMASDLRELCLSLGKSKLVDPAKPKLSKKSK